MNHRWLLTLGIAVTLGCSPSSDDNSNTGSGGARAGGSGGARSGGSSGSGAGGNVSTGGTSPSTGGVSGGAGTGGSAPGGAGGSASGSGGSKADGPRGSGGSGGSSGDGGGASMGGPAGGLNDLVVKVPCPAGSTGGSCNVAMRTIDKSVTIGGDPAVTYKVKLHMCAIFETRPYNGCTAGENSRICINGTPAPTPSNAPTYPTLALKVADPAKTYYLNSMWQPDTIVKLDYSATFEMKGGTTVQILSDGGSNGGVYTGRMKNVSCDGVPASEMIMQPYAGQFAFFKVESVTP